MQEQWKEFGAQVGFVLKNVFLPVVRRVNAVLSSMISAVQAAKEKLADIFGWESSASSASASVGAVADSYDEVTDSAEEAAAAMDKTLTSYDEIHKLGEEPADTQQAVRICSVWLPTSKLKACPARILRLLPSRSVLTESR